MKKCLMITFCMLFCIFSAQGVFADPEDDATAHVNCRVDPNITMEPAGTDIMMNVQTGIVEGLSTFRIDANTQYVDLLVACTNLYKADDPNSEVPPIEVYGPAGSDVNPESGIGRNVPLPNPADIGGFIGLESGQEQFQSSQNGHFSQDVTVTCSWDQPDPEKPEGDYSGFMRLIGMVVPGT